MHRNRLTFALITAVVAMCGSRGTASATITVYTSQASFMAAHSPLTLQATFESEPLGAIPYVGEGILQFSSMTSALYVIGPSLPGPTSPAPPSQMLTCNGPDDIWVVLGGWTPAVGFTLLTNQYAAGTVTLYNGDLVPIFTYTPTQAPNTVGFVGFVGTTEHIEHLRWQANGGQDQNTALDNFYIDDVAITPARSSTWGRIKALYR